jgi:uncharacterized protein DUF3489
MAKPKKANTAAKSPAPKVSNSDKLHQLLRGPTGASIAEVTKATGWLPHSARAMLTGLRKKGFTIAKAKVEGVTRYSINAQPVT